MNFNSLTFLLGEASRNVRRNGLMTLAALGTVTVALSVLGGAIWTAVRLNEYAHSQPEKFNRIDVFASVDTDRLKVKALQRKVQELPGVRLARLVSKEEAWAILQRQDPTLTEALPKNPLSDKIEVELTDPALVSALAVSLRNRAVYSEVEKVIDAGEEVRALAGLGRVIKVVGGGIALGLFTATLFIIHNTIRLTVYARRREIRIMQLVGATPGFIRLPLLLEGGFHGAVGGLLAGAILLVCGREVSKFVANVKSPILGDVPSRIQPGQMVAIIVGLGVLLGFSGSYLAIRRFLRQL